MVPEIVCGPARWIRGNELRFRVRLAWHGKISKAVQVKCGGGVCHTGLKRPRVSAFSEMIDECLENSVHRFPNTAVAGCSYQNGSQQSFLLTWKARTLGQVLMRDCGVEFSILRTVWKARSSACASWTGLAFGSRSIGRIVVTFRA